MVHCDMNADTPKVTVPSRYRLVGVLPLIFFGLHTAYHVGKGDPENMLWGCHLSNLLIGVGLLTSRPAVLAVGLLWACPLLFQELSNLLLTVFHLKAILNICAPFLV